MKGQKGEKYTQDCKSIHMYILILMYMFAITEYGLSFQNKLNSQNDKLFKQQKLTIYQSNQVGNVK